MQAQFFVVVISILLLVGCTVRRRNCLLSFGSGSVAIVDCVGLFASGVGSAVKLNRRGWSTGWWMRVDECGRWFDSNVQGCWSLTPGLTAIL